MFYYCALHCSDNLLASTRTNPLNLHRLLYLADLWLLFRPDISRLQNDYSQRVVYHKAFSETPKYRGGLMISALLHYRFVLYGILLPAP